MVNYNSQVRSNEVRNLHVELFQILDDYGINKAHIARRVGRPQSTFFSWRQNGISYPLMEPAVKELISIGRRLKRFNIETDSVEDLPELSGLYLASIAKRLRISKQRFSKHLEDGLSESRKQQVQAVVRRIGSDVLTKARNLSKTAH